MQGINVAVLTGRLGRDPEMRQTTSGRALCRFSIATGRNRRVGEGWVEDTDWHDIVLWEGQAERAGRILSKGDMCSVEGRIQCRSWQDAEGKKRRQVEIVGHRFELLAKNTRPRQDAARPVDAGQQARSQAALPDPVPEPVPAPF